MEPESKFVAANGIRHHYLAWGSPENQPVVMVHAIGFCAQVWNVMARDLARDYYVLCPDLRAHGDTDNPGGGYTFHQIGADTAALIQALEIDRPWGIGHSAGGMSLLIADSMFPGLVDKVVLVDTRVGASPMMMLSPEERVQRMERTAQKRLIWDSREAMYEAYRGRRVFQPWADEVFNDYIQGGTRLLEDGRAELKCPNDAEAAFYESRVDLDPASTLLGLKGRYRLLVGNYDGAQTEQDAAVQHLIREAPSFQLKPLPRGSHFVPMEHPGLVLAEIREFLDHG